MSDRRPRTAAHSNALPSLAALLASGVAIQGCDTPIESAARLRRLTEHGEQAGRALDGHETRRAAVEVGVGLGLFDSPPETRIQSPGEAPVVQLETPIETAGVAAPIHPTPPPQPPNVDVDGGIRQIQPTPPAQVRPPRVPVRGGVSAVRPGGPGDAF